MPKKLTTEIFIEKAKIIHGDKYDYSKSNYINSKIKLIIMCPIHGDFEQEPCAHINGSGCGKCSRERITIIQRKSLDNFILESIKINGDIFNFDKANYINCRIPLEITCKIKNHNDTIYKTPTKILRGQGCPLCGHGRCSSEQYKKIASEIHNNKYDYSLTDFGLAAHTKIKIICPIVEHGIFEQTRDKHINKKHGCPICGGSQKKTLEQIIDKCKAIHGDLFDYSKSIYINFEEYIEIICGKHGSFWQTPHNHIIGKQGCPVCFHKISKGEMEWLNYIGVPDDKSHRNVLLRFSDRKIKADGYDPITNTVYEYYGNYYHGNPAMYKSEDYNEKTNCTFGELYNKLLAKEKSIINAGFNLIYIWEKDWKEWKRANASI